MLPPYADHFAGLEVAVLENGSVETEVPSAWWRGHVIGPACRCDAGIFLGVDVGATSFLPAGTESDSSRMSVWTPACCSLERPRREIGGAVGYG